MSSVQDNKDNLDAKGTTLKQDICMTNNLSPRGTDVLVTDWIPRERDDSNKGICKGTNLNVSND